MATEGQKKAPVAVISTFSVWAHVFYENPVVSDRRSDILRIMAQLLFVYSVGGISESSFGSDVDAPVQFLWKVARGCQGPTVEIAR